MISLCHLFQSSSVLAFLLFGSLEEPTKKKKIIFHACSLCISLLSSFFSISYFSHLLYLPSDHRKPWKDKPKKKRKRKNHLSSLFSLSFYLYTSSVFFRRYQRERETNMKFLCNFLIVNPSHATRLQFFNF